jgi:hypothetical protein
MMSTRYQLCSVILAVTMLVSFTTANVVPLPGQYVTQVNFNMGLEEADKTCPHTEWTLVKSTMEEAVQQSRNSIAASSSGKGSGTRKSRGLKGKPSSKASKQYPGQGERRAQSKCNCGSHCYAVAGCGGKGGRRMLVKEEEPKEIEEVAAAPPAVEIEERDLQSASPCANDMIAINASLATLLQQLPSPLSTSCHALVAAPRELKCVPAVSCGVSHVNVWNANNNSVVREMFTGGVLCNKDPQTFTAETNYEPGRVLFTLTGSVVGANGGFATTRFVNTEYGAPFFLHPRKNGDVQGAHFAIGNYSLRIAGDAGTEALTVNFTVTNQC